VNDPTDKIISDTSRSLTGTAFDPFALYGLAEPAGWCELEMIVSDLESFGENVRQLFPGAEFQDENGEWSLTIRIQPGDQPGEWRVTYNG
jgi:hypothetical protein